MCSEAGFMGTCSLGRVSLGGFDRLCRLSGCWAGIIRPGLGWAGLGAFDRCRLGWALGRFDRCSLGWALGRFDRCSLGWEGLGWLKRRTLAW
jgi:hypothetical protein